MAAVTTLDALQEGQTPVCPSSSLGTSIDFEQLGHIKWIVDM